MTNVDLCIIGAGPAAMAAALSARAEGVQDILLLERSNKPGGILNQCIHNGFGLHYFKEELTGPEYARRFEDKLRAANIPVKLDTMVLDISPDWSQSKERSAAHPSVPGRIVTAVNSTDGVLQIKAKAIILAMGCRERTRGALNILGSRPSGILTAGAAQLFVNMEGKMPGKNVVILGSGDIGLIMARRMTLEGAAVKMVCELMPYSGGLQRNIVQCLEDFDIPLHLSHTIIQIHGKTRLEGVTVAAVDTDMKPIPETAEYVPCDTLLLSVGLIPENELSTRAGIAMDSVTGGPTVNAAMETSLPGVFACGNVVHVHDLVDFVTLESERAGRGAAQFIQNLRKAFESLIHTEGGAGVRYIVPQTIDPANADDQIHLFFRVQGIYKKTALQVIADGTVIRTINKPHVAPGEMESLKLDKKLLPPDCRTITLALRGVDTQ